MRAPRARRSELATPASSERMCEKARRLGRRPRVPRPRGRLRPGGQGGGPGHRRRRADGPRLGPHGAGRAGQRPRHAVVPRRHHRDRHRRPGGARRAHRAQGAVGPRRLVGRRPAHPARDQARPRQARSASRCSSRRPRAWPTPPRSPGPATGSRRSSSAPATSRRRCTPGSTATSIRSASTPATSGTSPGSRSWPRRGRPASTPSTRPIPAYQDPDGLPAGRGARQPARASTASGRSIPSQVADRQRGVRPDRRARSPRPREAIEAYREVGGRRRRRHRARRQARRRRPHAARRQRAVQGGAGSATTVTESDGRVAATDVPGGAVGHRQHRRPLPAGRDRASPTSSWSGSMCTRRTRRAATPASSAGSPPSG